MPTPADLTARLAAKQAAAHADARRHSRDLTVKALATLAIPAALALAVLLVWAVVS